MLAQDSFYRVLTAEEKTDVKSKFFSFLRLNLTSMCTPTPPFLPPLANTQT